jgi:hypothetical protein
MRRLYINEIRVTNPKFRQQTGSKSPKNSIITDGTGKFIHAIARYLPNISNGYYRNNNLPGMSYNTTKNARI